VAEVKAEFNRALDSVARFLAMRDHSQHELKTKLKRRFEEPLVEAVVAEAEARGWLIPEERIAENLVAALERRGKSFAYIQLQLRKRRLPVPAMNSENEIEKARQLLVKKFGEEKLSYEDKAKAFRFLKYRGFPDSAIRKAME
jgi:regulatory protein